MTISESKSNEMRRGAQEAERQKAQVLSKDGAGYTPIPHTLFRKVLPELCAKYDGKTARDCLTLLLYLHAYTHGNKTNDYYMWAFPNVMDIRNDTGIHANRVTKLRDILVSEGLLRTINLAWNGNSKRMYLPLYFTEDTAVGTYESAQEDAGDTLGKREDSVEETFMLPDGTEFTF